MKRVIQQGNKMRSSAMLITILIVTILIDVMGMCLVLPILPNLFFGGHALLLSAHVDHVWHQVFYGLALGAWPLGAVFGTPYLGELSDRVGRKRVLQLGIFGTAATYAVCAVSVLLHSYMIFLIGRLLAGFFAGNFTIAQAAVVDVSKPEHRARNMGFITFAASIGVIIGPLIAYAASRWLGNGSLTVFIFACVISLLNLLSLTVFMSKGDASLRKSPLRISAIFTSFKTIITDSRTQFLSLIYFIQQLGWGMFIQVIPLVFAFLFGGGTALIAQVFAAMGLGIAVATALFQPWLFKRMSLKTCCVLSMLLTALALLAATVKPTLASEWILVVFAGFVEVVAFSATLALFSNAVNDDEQGAVMGGTGTIWGLAWAANALFIAVSGKASPLFPVVVAGGLFIIGGALMMAYRVTQKSSPQAPLQSEQV